MNKPKPARETCRRMAADLIKRHRECCFRGSPSEMNLENVFADLAMRAMRAMRAGQCRERARQKKSGTVGGKR